MPPRFQVRTLVKTSKTRLECALNKFSFDSCLSAGQQIIIAAYFFRRFCVVRPEYKPDGKDRSRSAIQEDIISRTAHEDILQPRSRKRIIQRAFKAGLDVFTRVSDLKSRRQYFPPVFCRFKRSTRRKKRQRLKINSGMHGFTSGVNVGPVVPPDQSDEFWSQQKKPTLYIANFQRSQEYINQEYSKS